MEETPEPWTAGTPNVGSEKPPHRGVDTGLAAEMEDGHWDMGVPGMDSGTLTPLQAGGLWPSKIFCPAGGSRLGRATAASPTTPHGPRVAGPWPRETRCPCHGARTPSLQPGRPAHSSPAAGAAVPGSPWSA